MKPRDYQSQSGEEQKTVGAPVLHPRPWLNHFAS